MEKRGHLNLNHKLNSVETISARKLVKACLYLNFQTD